MNNTESLEYIVGEEKYLADILTADELTPLFQGAVHAGAAYICLHDEQGAELCRVAGSAPVGGQKVSRNIIVEGQPAGLLEMAGDRQLLAVLEPLMVQVVHSMIQANLKRMLTTEMHTKVVNQSWEELLEANRLLTASETRYRELAESLEVKVEERTSELRQAQIVMLEREKMAAIGQLAAGIAHEINNPMGFVTSNIVTLRKYSSRLWEMLHACREALLESGAMPVDITVRWGEMKIEQIVADLPELFGQTLEGATRVKRIVADLKGFSHVDEVGETEVQLTDEIDRTLNVLAHEIPVDAEIVRDYEALPPFRCQPDLICQVFLSLIQNALQIKPRGLKLAIGAKVSAGEIMIAIADNGPGIPLEIRSRIFEPFFTTKAVGSGTGMGLAVVYDVIRKHGGSITAGESPSGGRFLRFGCLREWLHKLVQREAP